MSHTVETKTPNPPSWVTKAGKETTWAWKCSLSWRADAAQAQTERYRKLLIKEARRVYHA